METQTIQETQKRERQEMKEKKDPDSFRKIEIKYDENGFYASIDGDDNGMPYYDTAEDARTFARWLIKDEDKKKKGNK